MKELVKRVWWKVPLYCIAGGYICWWLMVGYIGRLAIVTLPDGTITSDNDKWFMLSGALMVVFILLGGLLFFRKMTRKELLCSATVMFIFNVVTGIFSYVTNANHALAFFLLEIQEWHSFIPQLLYKLGVNDWISAFISWATAFVFVPFGRKTVNREKPE